MVNTASDPVTNPVIDPWHVFIDSVAEGRWHAEHPDGSRLSGGLTYQPDYGPGPIFVTARQAITRARQRFALPLVTSALDSPDGYEYGPLDVERPQAVLTWSGNSFSHFPVHDSWVVTSAGYSETVFMSAAWDDLPGVASLIEFVRDQDAAVVALHLHGGFADALGPIQ